MFKKSLLCFIIPFILCSMCGFILLFSACENIELSPVTTDRDLIDRDSVNQTIDEGIEGDLAQRGSGSAYYKYFKIFNSEYTVSGTLPPDGPVWSFYTAGFTTQLNWIPSAATEYYADYDNNQLFLPYDVDDFCTSLAGTDCESKIYIQINGTIDSENSTGPEFWQVDNTGNRVSQVSGVEISYYNNRYIDEPDVMDFIQLQPEQWNGMENGYGMSVIEVDLTNATLQSDTVYELALTPSTLTDIYGHNTDSDTDGIFGETPEDNRTYRFKTYVDQTFSPNPTGDLTNKYNNWHNNAFTLPSFTFFFNPGLNNARLNVNNPQFYYNTAGYDEVFVLDTFIEALTILNATTGEELSFDVQYVDAANDYLITLQDAEVNIDDTFQLIYYENIPESNYNIDGTSSPFRLSTYDAANYGPTTYTFWFVDGGYPEVVYFNYYYGYNHDLGNEATTIQIRFDTPMDTATLIPQNISIMDSMAGDYIGIEIEVINNQEILIYALEENTTTWTLTIDSDVRDADGNTIGRYTNTW